MKVIQDIINELFFKNHIAIKVKIVFLAVVNSILAAWKINFPRLLQTDQPTDRLGDGPANRQT